MAKVSFANMKFDIDGWQKLLKQLNYLFSNIDSLNITGVETPVSNKDNSTIYGSTRIEINGSSGITGDIQISKNSTSLLSIEAGIIVGTTATAPGDLPGATGTYTFGGATLEVENGLIITCTT